MNRHRQRLDMFEPAVFRIRIQGVLGENWRDYFCFQALSTEVDQAGYALTTLTSEPVDQAALVGLINSLNALGLPLVSVDHVSDEGRQP